MRDFVFVQTGHDFLKAMGRHLGTQIPVGLMARIVQLIDFADAELRLGLPIANQVPGPALCISVGGGCSALDLQVISIEFRS